MARRSSSKTKTGGDCVQNPSDLDATYSGHKGPGYQVQLAETCVPSNEVQLITAALPQTACEPDAAAVVPMLDQLEQGRAAARGTPGRHALHRRRERPGRRGAGRGPGRSDPRPCAEVDPEALTVDDFALGRAHRHDRRLPRGPSADVVFARRGDGDDAGRDAGVGLRRVPVSEAMPDQEDT